MDFIYKYITINSQKYGKLKQWICSKNKYGNAYFLVINKGKKTLSGLVDENGKEIIPIDNMELSGMLIANCGKDICFEFMHENSNIPESYHIKVLDDKTAKLVFKTDYKASIPSFICKSDDTDEFWYIQLGIQNKKYAIYDYKNNKIISNYFDEVRYQNNGNDHSFYYSLGIEREVSYSNDIKIPHIFSSLCGFLDEKGNLSSQIYDTQSNVLYSSYMYGPDTLSPKFCELVRNVTDGYERLYHEKYEHIDDVLSNMYYNCNMSEKPKNYKEGSKILDFSKRKKM